MLLKERPEDRLKTENRVPHSEQSAPAKEFQITQGEAHAEPEQSAFNLGPGNPKGRGDNSRLAGGKKTIDPAGQSRAKTGKRAS